MQHRTLIAVVVAIAFAVGANLSLAAQSQVGTAAATTGKAKPANQRAKAPAKAKPVDINSANKAQLMKVTGIGDAQADQIIAGRPFLTKAHLVTRKIIPGGIYMNIKDQIVARQK